MRLRQLGSTQSIVFFAPPEVHQSIIDVGGSGYKQHIDSSHVVRWLLEQTSRANEQMHDLYMAQGVDFCRRINAQWENEKFLSDKDHRAKFLKVIQYPERQTLEQLHGGKDKPQASSHIDMSFPMVKGFMKKLGERRSQENGNGTASLSSAMEEVEQEREVEFQVEQVRQVQKPKHWKALAFPGLHVAISRFACTGKLTGGDGYEDYFTTLARTKVGQKYHTCGITPGLFVSMEFIHTVKLGPHDDPMDKFLVSTVYKWCPLNNS